MISGKHRNQALIDWLRLLKRSLSLIPAGSALADGIQKIIFHFWFKNQEELFTYYYDSNKWGDPESLSGPGSSLAATILIRSQLPGLLIALKVLKILDAPCGDYHWFKLIPFAHELEYLGGDIVKEVVDVNNRQYGNNHTKFIHLDIMSDKLPDVPLWLCRDALFHFSNNDIRKVLENLGRSKIRYFLSTTFPEVQFNKDIKTGDFRPINLEKAPFNLPSPLKYLDDSAEDQKGKKLGVWDTTLGNFFGVYIR